MREQRAGKDASGETGDGVGLLLQIPHNGEINTIRGNADRMLAREETIASPVMDGDMDKILPVVDQGGFGSSMLDNTLEFLMMNGMELPQAVMLCIPEPWARDRRIDRFLPLLRHHDGALGRPRRHRLLRQGHGGRGAGPERTPALPVVSHRRCGFSRR